MLFLYELFYFQFAIVFFYSVQKAALHLHASCKRLAEITYMSGLEPVTFMFCLQIYIMLLTHGINITFV